MKEVSAFLTSPSPFSMSNSRNLFRCSGPYTCRFASIV